MKRDCGGTLKCFTKLCRKLDSAQSRSGPKPTTTVKVETSPTVAWICPKTESTP